MKKLLTAFLVLCTCSLSAQTLFHYGSDSVSVQEFMRAYTKNNTGVRSEKGLREYLDLYIASRLKIREARELGYDTLPQIAADLQNLRNQIVASYVNDRSAVDRMVEEAFVRSQKNIHIAHIFIRHNTDPQVTERKKAEVLAALKTGTFSEAAKKFSDDPSAKDNGGDIGWISVFTLPYALENLAYTTPVGGHSAFYESKAGFHLFRNLGERRDKGKMKAAQILLAFPPNADAATVSRTKKLADSLYSALRNGADFGKLAAQFSNDVVSAAAKGQMQEFGTGQYEPAFENTVFALPADGAISKPFLSSYGYHIVKRISKSPVVTVKSEAVMQAIREKVEQSDRINTVKAALAARVRHQAGFKKLNAAESGLLYRYTDSILMGKPATGIDMQYQTGLLQLGAKTYTVQDWINHVQISRYKPDGYTIKTYPELWSEYVDAMSVRYYEENLEKFNEEFRQQLTEFSEGNLFFEIMQRRIWGPAQSDSVALMKYFQQHAAAYTWKQSADAVVFYAPDLATAQSFSKALKKNPTQWQALLNDYTTIAADSSRMELAQIPNASKSVLKAGVITQPLVNKADNTAALALLLRVYHQSAPRSFEQARGLVINDYQTELEKEWIEELKKKYPVRVNQPVLKGLIEQKRF